MKNILKFIGIALLTFTFAFADTNTKIIVIDIGHGEKDSGAQFENISEKDVVLSIAKKIQENHKSNYTKIILTRNSDAFISLEDRTKMINKINPDFVISLHANFHQDESKSGTEIYISENNKEIEKSQQLAQNIAQIFGIANNQIKNANFNILKNVNCPSALVELGFLSNQEDRTILTSEEGQLDFASKILKVINKD
ncbi:N-acetylmuramoyl-L-alanine amidase [Brumimicrobium glaciale]|uniref:N-acetylmuramoyl-L-alanine amidase n=1 Tax=Brumimicrobium glaciale TaxID=200475 RepID=A0A4Q4KT16_9FLAO|nr:N-acetylmuramoyl-L-alanine amidase [Brumimicrobium glaciale]RYM35859.1 N-acetylmuramoyl-L-alanine amidase [Brumimicrobium glaciale]